MQSRHLPLLLLVCTALFAHAQEPAPFEVTIRVDAAKPLGELKPVWRFFGADEPNDAYMKDGAKFEDVPLFAGFRQLASGGLDLPVLNVFRMFSRMDSTRLTVESDGALALDEILRSGVRAKPDVAALASLGARKAAVLVWHYHDDDVPGPAAKVTLAFTGLPLETADAKLRHFRIDDAHSNVFEAWKKLGSPAKPTTDEYLKLEKAGQLEELEPARVVSIAAHAATLNFSLPRQGVSLLELEW